MSFSLRKKFELISRQVDLMAIDLVRIDLMKGSPLDSQEEIAWVWNWA